MSVEPEAWFLPSSDGRPFTTGNQAQAFVDGRHYFADLKSVLTHCDKELDIAGWRVSSDQILDPTLCDGKVSGESFIDAVVAVLRRGAAVKAMLFNVPGTNALGPFRIWHALDNREFCDRLIAAGGDAILDSRLSRVPASSHHQKFLVSLSSDPKSCAAYLGGIDVCFDRWDQPAHDQAPERQRDFVREGELVTYQPSQPGWHDVQLKLSGPAVTQLWSAFSNRWNDPRPPNRDPLLSKYCGRTRIESEPPSFSGSGSLAVQINQTLPEGVFPDASGDGEQTIALALSRAIDHAQHFIYIEDQYVWPCVLVERLEAALGRGVRVIVVVARDYDAPGLAVFARRLRAQVVDRLRRAGQDRFCIMHLEQPDGEQIYVHSKLLIVDDRFVSIGSANFNARSLVNDTEIQASIVDTDTLDIPFNGEPQAVGRFCHELRCRIWAEHLETVSETVRDPIVTFDQMWSRESTASGRRAVPHVIKHGLLDLDAVSEYLTTAIVHRLAHVPLVQLPPGVTERSVIKLLVDAELRGPLAASLFKFVEEMLNPDLTPTFAAVTRSMIGSTPAVGNAAVASEGEILANEPHYREATALIKRLRKGRMPRMVDWIDPLLLGAVAVRTIISSTIGQYADQRPMQAAMDPSSPEDLQLRHDYSGVALEVAAAHVAPQLLTRDDQGRAWLDFVADLGDGFEATYTMAYLMASPHLDVEVAGGKSVTLPAGQVLVFGGDLAYPNATIKEYQDRCLMPYDMAYRTAHPQRQLFYIAGNHDWYDGLTAFTSVFCTARDRFSHGIGKQIGGWRCHQRRSYFALKMPHDWWLWGVDLALTDTIDDAQLDYFHTMSEATKPGDKVIIITHAPGWVNKEIAGLREMTMLARSRGAEVPVVLAGDLHHYSRYYSAEADVHLFTSGGGGAFAHATHQLSSRLSVDWAVKTDASHRISGAEDTPEFNREEREAVGDDDPTDFKAEKIDAVSVRNVASRTWRELQRPGFFKALDFRSPNFYPERWRSRLLVLRNLWLPLHNRRFAVMLGLVYMVFGWLFQLSVADPVEQMRKAQYATVEFECLSQLKVGASAELLAQCQTDAYRRIDENVGKIKLALPASGKDKPHNPPPQIKGQPTAEQWQQLKRYLWVEAETLWQALLLSVSPKRVVIGMLNNPAFFILVLGLWIGLMHYVDVIWSNRSINWMARIVFGSLHFAAHMALLLIITSIFSAMVYDPMVDARNGLWAIASGVGIYTLLIIIFGGFLGGMVWGTYWALTSAVFGMHMDAFSALGIANYKNFLRMSFEPDRLTIYPVGIRKIPGRRGWRAPDPGEKLPPHNPLILPKRALSPRLIEKPIVIEAKRGR